MTHVMGPPTWLASFIYAFAHKPSLCAFAYVAQFGLNQRDALEAHLVAGCGGKMLLDSYELTFKLDLSTRRCARVRLGHQILMPLGPRLVFRKPGVTPPFPARQPPLKPSMKIGP